MRDDKISRTVDVAFSIFLTFLSPVIAGYGFFLFKNGDGFAKLSSFGIIFTSILLFGIACMGLNRMKRFFLERRYQDGY
jgi:hypothetical protein